MRTYKSSRDRNISICFLVSFILIALGTAGHFYRTKLFNNQYHDFSPADKKNGTSFTIKPRGGVSDSWDKYDVQIGDEICTLKGCTYEGVLSNLSKYKIAHWTLRIDIHDDCFINNAWCGTVEIHQRSKINGSELIQELDLRNITDRDSIMLDYVPVGQDILIELHPGDYVIYNLSSQAMEAPVSAFNGSAGETAIGFIFYYLNSKTIDLSDYHGTFRYYKTLFQGTEAIILCIVIILWFLLSVVRISSLVAYKRASEETEKRLALQRMRELEEYNEEIRETNRQLEQSNDVIRAVSEIYHILYSIDFEKDTFTEIRSETEISRYFKNIQSAKSAVKSIPEKLFVQDEQEKVKEFFDIEKWSELLHDRDIISGDFLGITKGWIRTNIIVAKRDTDGNVIRVLCAIQDVNQLVKEEQEQKRRLEEANIIMKSYNEALNAEVTRKTAHIVGIQNKVVRGLANVIGNRDMDTVGHVNRTSEVIKIIVDEYRKQFKDEAGFISDQKALDIVRAAPMHDLGKIYIDTTILCKPGRFTDEEFQKMKLHSTFSGDIVNFVLKDVEEPHFVKVAFNVARFHHERWDGTGYPDKLAGEKIPLEARLMAIADVYDALVSKRCYKEPMSFDEAFNIMCEGMGTQFDPSLKPVFIAVRHNLEEYYLKSNEAYPEE